MPDRRNSKLTFAPLADQIMRKFFPLAYTRLMADLNLRNPSWRKSGDRIVDTGGERERERERERENVSMA